MGFGCGDATEAHVGHTLLRQFVQGGQRELTVRERLASLRPEAEVRPDDLVAEPDQARQVGRRRRARPHIVERGLIEARSPSPHLVRDVHRMALAHEVLVPSHPTVGRRLPRLAGQRRAVHHHDGHVAVAALRHHVPHVHLIDGDVPARAKVAQLTLRLFDLLAADEEAALRLEHQRRVRRLDVLERLRAARRRPCRALLQGRPPR